jgi:hypothetical protein
MPVLVLEQGQGEAGNVPVLNGQLAQSEVVCVGQLLGSEEAKKDIDQQLQRQCAAAVKQYVPG